MTDRLVRVLTVVTLLAAATSVITTVMRCCATNDVPTAGAGTRPPCEACGW